MEETRTELQMIKLSEIQSQEISWLWYPFIPYGKLTIVQGDPGDGKTRDMTKKLAALVEKYQCAIEPDCREGVRAQLERMKELCKERNNLYEKQNDLKGQKRKIEKLLER